MSINKIINECIGCENCFHICPVNAVHLQQSEDGYLYPDINSTVCVECGLCEKKCPLINKYNFQSLDSAYYGFAKDKNLVMKSSSGGAFSLIADDIINNGGVVFGAIFDKNTKQVLYKSTDSANISELRKSKYVESRVGNVFSEAEVNLKKGRKVLFVGMPCHIAALKLFLGKEYDNLITCDFICGGSSSTKFFQEHLNDLERKYRSKVENVDFRPKLYGWNLHSIKIDFENGKTYKNYGYTDSYFRGYIYEKAFVRESCYDCKFVNNHASDIILADFWGYNQLQEIKNDNTGISLLVANSEKGANYIKNISETDAEINKIPLEYAMYNFKEREPLTEKRNLKKEFMKLYKCYGFEKTAKKLYMKKCVLFKIKQKLKTITEDK